MKKISFNYYLTNVVIPKMIFANQELFFEKILPSSNNLQLFLEDCMHFINENSGDNVEKFHGQLDFTTAFFELKDKTGLIFVTIPDAIEVLDCFCIAVTTDKKNPRYFTLEKGQESFDPQRAGQENNVVGEWVLENKAFEHRNWGYMDNHRLSAFCEKLEHILTKD